MTTKPSFDSKGSSDVVAVEMNPLFVWPKFGGKAIHRYGYQAHIPDDAEYVHTESLTDFAKKKGKGFKYYKPVDQSGGMDTKYIFIITRDNIIKYADLNDNPYAIIDTKIMVNPGHSSLLAQHDYINAYENKAGKIVKYAGNFYVNKQGKVTKWDNISHHFNTLKRDAPKIATQMGFDVNLFKPRICHSDQGDIPKLIKIYKCHKHELHPLDRKDVSNLIKFFKSGKRGISKPHKKHQSKHNKAKKGKFKPGKGGQHKPGKKTKSKHDKGEQSKSNQVSTAMRGTFNMLQSSYYDDYGAYNGYNVNNEYNSWIAPSVIDNDMYSIYAIYSVVIVLLACIILYALCFIIGILCGKNVSEHIQINEKKHDIINSNPHIDVCVNNL